MIKRKSRLVAAALMTIFTYVVLTAMFLAAFDLIGPDRHHSRTTDTRISETVPLSTLYI